MSGSVAVLAGLAVGIAAPVGLAAAMDPAEGLATLKRQYAATTRAPAWVASWVQYAAVRDVSRWTQLATAAQLYSIRGSDGRELFPSRTVRIWGTRDERRRIETRDTQASRGPDALTTSVEVIGPGMFAHARTLRADQVFGSLYTPRPRAEQWDGVDIIQPGMREFPQMLVARLIEWFEDHPTRVARDIRADTLSFETDERGVRLVVKPATGAVVSVREAAVLGGMFETRYEGQVAANVYPAPQPERFTVVPIGADGQAGEYTSVFVCTSFAELPHAPAGMFEWQSIAPVLRDDQTHQAVARVDGAVPPADPVASAPRLVRLMEPPDSSGELPMPAGGRGGTWGAVATGCGLVSVFAALVIWFRRRIGR